jgi:methionine-rich copper-binding protein CopC
MRYIVNKFVLTVVMLLSATMMWAADEVTEDVTIVKKLNGTTNSGAGTVTSAISNGKCTLTVTPASGNYITVDYITAERVVSGGVAQAPRRRAVGMDNNIVVSPVSSSADPSGETKYTFDMPGADYKVEVVANFQSRTSISGATITLTQTTFTYDGEAKTPAIQSVVVGGKTLATNDYSFEYSNNINVGKATVSLTGQRTYMGSATAEFTISAASAVITKAPAAIENLTYTGQAQTLITAGEATGGELQYKLGTDGTYGTTLPAATDAGTYTVYYKVVGDDNHSDVAEASVEVTIAKAAITPTVTLQGWAYGNDANTPVVEGNLGKGTETFTYAVKGSATFAEAVPSTVGEYVVKVTIAETANYLGAEATAEFKISSSASVLTKTPAAIANLTYTGQAQMLVTAGEATGGELQYKLGTDGTYGTTVPAATDAGSYTVYYKVVGDDNHSDIAEASVEVTIAKAAITPTVTLQGWAYGADANTPVVEGNLGKGAETFTYAVKGSATFAEAVPSTVGEYVVKVTIAETANYLGAEATAEFKISSSASVLTKAPVAIENLTYTGQAQTLVTAGEATGGELQYKLGTDGTYGTTLPAGTDAGTYTVYYKVVGDANHSDVAEASVEVTIAKAAITPTVTLQGWAYGADANTPVVEGNLGKGAETFTYAVKGSTTFAEAVPSTVGEYVVKVTIAETANYLGAEATAEFKISSSASVLTKAPVAIENLTYTGQAQTLVTAGEATGGELQYKLGTDGTYGTTVPAGTDAGTYTVYYKVVGDDNHSDVAEASVEVTIAKAAITPTVTLQGWDYRDTPNTPVVEGNLGNGQVTFTYKAADSDIFTTTVPSTPGTYTVKATIAETANYLAGLATADFTIETVWLVVNDIKVTNENRLDILKDGGTVTFNGRNQLTLTKAEINGNILSYIDKLIIYLKEDNKINGTILGEQAELVFTTEGNSPGKLELKSDKIVIDGFKTIVYEQNLTMLAGSPDSPQMTIGTPVKPIADEKEPENKIDLGDTGGEDDLSNIIINEVLYTLDSGNDDGINPEEKSVVLGSTMVDDDINDVIDNYTPGTDEFAEHFSGVTFMVPAGTGEIIVVAKTGEDGILHVKIGSADPKVFTGILEYTELRIPYACQQATYVYIYNASPAVETAESGDHRAGKKTTVTVGLSSVGVNASGVQSSNNDGNVNAGSIVLKDDDIIYDRESGTVIATNSEVTSIVDESFSAFPFLKYIDLRNTQITGVHISRKEGPFKGVSKNTFIYMPIGNTTNEPNVIIGNVCEKILLDGDMTEDESFGLSDNFTASAIDFNRLFMKDEVSTLYLPFPISQAAKKFFGTFYTVKKVVDGKVVVKEVEGEIKAHTPYLFKAAADGTKLFNHDVIEMSMPEQSAGARRAESTGKLVGCYDFYNGEGKTEVFILVPNDNPEMISFERIHAGGFIKPFQAYLLSDAEGTTLGVTDKEEATGIKTIANGQQQTPNSQYYDLQGRRITNGHQPTAKGIYITNGQKTVIR